MNRAGVALALALALTACGGREPAPGPVHLEIRAAGPDGAPLPYLLVTLCGEGNTPVRALYDERLDLDADGRGTVEDLPPGRWALRLSTVRQFRSEEGFDFVHAAWIGLPGTPGEAAAPVVHDAVLRPGGRIRVGLTDADGRGVPARLFVRDEAGDPVATTFWRGDDGGWTTEHFPLSPPFTSCVLPAGRYRVEAWRYREVVASGETEVRAGETAELPLVLEERR